MPDVRATFLATLAVAADVFARPEVGARWHEPSALAEFSVRGLSGHLVRAAGSVDAYLDREEPPDHDVVDQVRYYAAAVGRSEKFDVDAPLHQAIRQRGEDAASGGWEALRADFEALITSMTTRLADEPATRRVRVYQDLVITLDDYLVTRLIELVVHIDDLCVSVGVEPPPLPAPAMDAAIATLVGIARVQRGDLAVLRALTRRERAHEGVLHVL
ncbi:MAG: hypothetical protein QOI20_1477 [Acidimicrobiaceae bacterium]|jgi:hypothetical protein|nr:hypothetical protein [Acidimicrobiaceae bacterium]